MVAGFSVPAAIALVIWGITYIRARRKAAGKQLLLDQETFDELLTLLRRLSNSPANQPPSGE